MPLAFALDPANLQVHGRRWQGGWRQYYAIPYGPHYIWGATARMLKTPRRPDARRVTRVGRRLARARRAPRPSARCSTDAGHQALFVGGCVRNALLGRPVADIDIATDARPERGDGARRRRRAQGGADRHRARHGHGGRRAASPSRSRPSAATSRPSAGARWSPSRTDLAEDAAPPRLHHERALRPARRHAGRPARRACPTSAPGRVRFVGDPGARIAEDYLRILRFFRFHAWYGDPARRPRPRRARRLRRRRSDGLARLSRERVGAEIGQAPRRARPGARRRRHGRGRHPRAGAARRRPSARWRRWCGSRRRPAAAPRWQRRLAALGPARRNGPRRCASPGPTGGAGEHRRARSPPARAPAATAYRLGPDAARDAALIARRPRRGAGRRRRSRPRSPAARRRSSRCAPATAAAGPRARRGAAASSRRPGSPRTSPSTPSACCGPRPAAAETGPPLRPRLPANSSLAGIGGLR